MREITCCFTGHRDLPLNCREALAAKLHETITELIQRRVQFYRAGGALGFDTLAAQTVLKLRKEYPSIKLVLMLPCLTQTRGWSVEDVREYEKIKGMADEVIYTSQEYTRGCMFRRNRCLVDNSRICVCYFTEDKGGTAYTVNYAKKQGLEIINLAPVPDMKL